MNLPEWPELFGGGPKLKTFRLVRKRGTPLLLLPERAALAARTLQLYPAQTPFARLSRAMLALALRSHLPTPVRSESLPFSAAAPIPSFVRECFGEDSDFGILLGNANAPGRRWILLIFDIHDQPCAIVKAGVSERARELIREEGAFLEKLPQGACFFPKLRGKLESSVSAIRMDFLPGQPPRDAGLISATLAPWLKTGKRRLAEFTAWARVRESDAPKHAIELIEKSLMSHGLSEALSHGDFAPWNVREHKGEWKVLDWERGEEAGVPGWDWLHFQIQVDVLVRRKSAQDVLACLVEMMRDAEFQTYAGKAGFSGKEISILCSYLAHAIYVNRQTEGLDTLKSLFDLSVVMLRAKAGSQSD